ncbi:hypothetical protein HG531_012820 [Fusarium graminearum]|nr:hypothetical protein HG531_012820 [Fusarium graminearum]
MRSGTYGTDQKPCERGWIRTSGCTDTTAILGNTDSDLFNTLGANAVNGSESFVDHVAEEGVVLNETTVDTNVNNLLVHVVELSRVNGDSTNGDSGQSSGTATDGIGNGLEGLGILQ